MATAGARYAIFFTNSLRLTSFPSSFFFFSMAFANLLIKTSWEKAAFCLKLYPAPFPTKPELLYVVRPKGTIFSNPSLGTHGAPALFFFVLRLYYFLPSRVKHFSLIGKIGSFLL